MTTYEPQPPEEDPTALDPGELDANDQLPGEEDVPERAVMPPEQAQQDETVDDAEHDTGEEDATGG